MVNAFMYRAGSGKRGVCPYQHNGINTLWGRCIFNTCGRDVGVEHDLRRTR